MRLLADPSAAEVKLIPSLNAIKFVGIKHQTLQVIVGDLKRLYGKRKEF